MKLNVLFLIILLSIFISCSDEDNETNDATAPISNIQEFEVTYNNQVLNSIGAFDILKILKKNDGFILFSNEFVTQFPLNSGIRITKMDNQFNFVWTLLINETVHFENLGGVFELDNNEFIAILSKMDYTNVGLNNNQVYGLKFNSSGTVLWQKNYSEDNVDTNTHLDYMIRFTNKSNELKVMFRSDSTYYNPNDMYFREVNLNSSGDVLSNTKLNYTDVNQFFDMIYDNNGDKYNFGGRSLVDFVVGGASYLSRDALLTKYTSDNTIIYDKTYGIPEIDDYFHSVLIDINNKSILVGSCGINASDHIYGRWIVEINSDGNIVWQIKEYKKHFTYYGKDIIQDDDSNYLSLFNDVNFGTNYATLIKSNNQGEIIWKFVDGEEENTDSFVPFKVLKYNDEYLIFGLKDEKIWLKKIRAL